MTESGFQPIGVAVIRFSIKPRAKDIKGYKAFAAPVFELPQVLPQVVLIVIKTLIIRCMHRVLLLMLCCVFLCFALRCCTTLLFFAFPFYYALLLICCLLCFCFPLNNRVHHLVAQMEKCEQFVNVFLLFALLTESGFQPIGVAVILFINKTPGKMLQDYRQG